MDVKTAEVGIFVVSDDTIVDGLEEGTVADDEDMSISWLLGFNAIKGFLGADKGILEGFAATKGRIEAEIEDVFGPGIWAGAFKLAEETFLQIVVKNNRTAVVDDDLGSLGGAGERGAIAGIDLVGREFVAQRLGLLDAGRVERGVCLALGDLFEVPIGLAVTNEI